MSAQEEQKSFKSTFGLIFSFLGCVVGTGNVWRFPRICAQNSDSEGSLVFLIVWFAFLFLWSSPMILIEYAMGRFSKNPPIRAFYFFLGNKAVWMGGWVTAVSFFISAYYSCILGWCLYYVVYTASVGELPSNDVASIKVFDDFTEGSSWPILTHAIALLVTSISVLGGVRWIEKSNMFLVPALLSILMFTFVWSLWQARASVGISFLFTPNWASFGNYRLWIDAISQNAFDTGAAAGLFTAYACYLTRFHGIVKYATTIPFINNIVSFICAITIFATAFSSLLGGSNVDYTITQSRIVEIMQTDGKGSTGFTFVWIPVLFSSLGIFGRILCVLFFVCLSFAGISSLISCVELTSASVMDFGVPRKIAVPVCGFVLFLVGLPSALKIEILTNQDFTWGFGLIISGLFFQLVVTIYGGLRFRKEVINEFGIGDWNLPIVWNFLVQVVAPIEAAALLIWWAYSLITSDPSGWYTLQWTSFMTTIVEWAVVIILLVSFNAFIVWKKPIWMQEHTEGLTRNPLAVSTTSLTRSYGDLSFTRGSILAMDNNAYNLHDDTEMSAIRL